MNEERYIFRQTILVILFIGLIAEIVFGLAPLREYNKRMEIKMEKHKNMKEKNILINKEEINSKIENNREEINNLLLSDFPLELMYMRIKMLSCINERLIEKLKII